MRRLFVLAIAILALVPMAGIGAQPAPPGTIPVTPDPIECGISPRSLEEVAPLLAATPVADAAQSATPFAFPPGEPADPETVAFVTATIREALAGGNAAGFLGVSALLTDTAISRDVARGAGDRGAEVLTFSDVSPAPEERRSLLAVLEVRDRGDGQLSALAIISDPTRSPSGTLVYIGLAEGARGAGGSDQYLYLIDELVADPYHLGGEVAAGTPNP